jgi:hypothetical protein
MAGILESTARRVSDVLPTAECTSVISLPIRSSEPGSSMSSPELDLSAGNASSIPTRSSPYSRTLSPGSLPQELYKQIPSPLTSPQLGPETITIRISGLKNNPKTYWDSTFSEVLRLPSDTLMEQLGNHLLKKQPGKPIYQTTINY